MTGSGHDVPALEEIADGGDDFPLVAGVTGDGGDQVTQ